MEQTTPQDEAKKASSEIATADPSLPAAVLPDLMELYGRDEIPVLREKAIFETLVNQSPKQGWLRIHPTIQATDKNGQKCPYIYLPIERIEWLLINVIRRWRVEVKDIKQIANSVVVAVRLHYWDQVYNEWTYHDGIGAAPLQTEKNAGAIEWDKIKNAAVQIGAPAAESYAVKDAAEKIGRLFGRDLNRKEIIPFENMLDRIEKYEKLLTTESKEDGGPH